MLRCEARPTPLSKEARDRPKVKQRALSSPHPPAGPLYIMQCTVCSAILVGCDDTSAAMIAHGVAFLRRSGEEGTWTGRHNLDWREQHRTEITVTALNAMPPPSPPLVHSQVASALP